MYLVEDIMYSCLDIEDKRLADSIGIDSVLILGSLEYLKYTSDSWALELSSELDIIKAVGSSVRGQINLSLAGYGFYRRSGRLAVQRACGFGGVLLHSDKDSVAAAIRFRKEFKPTSRFNLILKSIVGEAALGFISSLSGLSDYEKEYRIMTDPRYSVRWQLAARGYRPLDLAYDSEWRVRLAVAKTGLADSILINDTSARVRNAVTG